MSIDILKSIYNELLSYFVPQKIKYTIEGECRKCGNCCRQIRSYGLKNEKDLKIMQFFLPHYRRFFITGADEQGNIILSCKYLSEQGLCSVYEKRPSLCKNYPLKQLNYNAQMPDGCGYRVVKKEFKDYL